MPSLLSTPLRWVPVAVALVVTFAGCTGGLRPNPLPSGTPVSTATPTASPVPIPTTPAISVTQQASLPTVTPAPAGQTPQPVPVPVPSSAGFSGTFSLPISGASSIPAGTQVQTTLTNTAPNGLPTLTPAMIKRFMQSSKHTDVSGNATILLYLWLAFSAGVTTSSQPPITFTLPSAYVSSNVYYYVALYDSTRPALGWQLGFEGPGNVNGSQVTFTGNPSPFTFAPFDWYYFALYAQPETVATPSPAPTQSPTPAPTPTATPIVLSGIQLTAIGQTSTITPSFAGPYSAFSSNGSVATASVSGSTVTITAIGAGGPATITIGSSNGTETLQVTVTTTTIPVQ